jgi:phosphoglycolate phosphatase-like HAD superfamily hydrolase
VATSRLLTAWLPVVLWAALIFTLSSIPDLGTGLGSWDLVLRKIAHAAEFAVLGFLLVRALGNEWMGLVAGIAYAISDEIHQDFVPGRQAAVRDVLVDSAGVAVGVYVVPRLFESRLGDSPRRLLTRLGLENRQRRRSRDDVSGGQSPRQEGDDVSTGRPLAIELDAVLGDTRPLWRDWLDDAARRFRAIAPLDPDAVPADRGAAADELDRWARDGVGDWRAALERFAEERAPVYLRPDASVSASLRALASSGRRLGVFTDAPEPLARVALAQLGATRRIEAVEAGTGSLERLTERFGGQVDVVRSPAELERAAA